MLYILVIAATFGVMFLLDKGLTKLLRSRTQHHSGTAVRLKKHYGILSLALMILGALGILYGLADKNPGLLLGGLVIFPGGAYCNLDRDEGPGLAEFFSEQGYYCFVVKYRVSHIHDRGGIEVPGAGTISAQVHYAGSKRQAPRRSGGTEKGL